MFIYGETGGDRWIKGAKGLSACAIEIEATVERRARLLISWGATGYVERLVVGWEGVSIGESQSSSELATKSRRSNKGEKVKILAWCISPFTFLVEIHGD